MLSCSSRASPLSVDSCCAETFGGLFLSTQFWSTYTGLESEGQLLPANDWTLHGLWPDFCNGSYTQYCDLNRQYDPTPSPNTTNSLPNGTSYSFSMILLLLQHTDCWMQVLSSRRTRVPTLAPSSNPSRNTTSSHG